MLVVQAESMKDLVADVSNRTLMPNHNMLFTPHTANGRRTPLEKEKDSEIVRLNSLTLIDEKY